MKDPVTKAVADLLNAGHINTQTAIDMLSVADLPAKNLYEKVAAVFDMTVLVEFSGFLEDIEDIVANIQDNLEVAYKGYCIIDNIGTAVDYKSWTIKDET